MKPLWIVLVLAAVSLSGKAIIDYPALDLGEMYRSVSVGGSVRAKTVLTLVVLTNEISTEARQVLDDARYAAIIREPARLPAYFESLAEGYFSFGENARRALFGENAYAAKLKDERIGGQNFVLDPERDVRINVRGELTTHLSWGVAKQIFVSPAQLANLNYGTTGMDGIWRFNDAYMPGLNVGVNFSQNLFVTLLGTVANQLNIQIDHVSGRDANAYSIQWHPEDKTPTKISKAIIQKVEVGDVSLDLGGKSTFISYGGINRKAFGVRAELERDGFSANAVLSLSKGLVETRSFVGSSEFVSNIISDSYYMKRRFYNLGKRNIVRYAIYRAGATAPVLRVNGVLFEPFVGEFVDKEKGVVDFGSERTVSETIIIFFTWLNAGVETSMPVTNETDGVRIYPYNRADAAYTYTVITNTNVVVSNYSGGAVNMLDTLYATTNFVVLADAYENGRNPFEYRTSYAIDGNIDDATLEIRLRDGAVGSDVPNEAVHAISRRGSFNATGPFTIDYDKSRIVFDSPRPFASNEYATTLVNTNIYDDSEPKLDSPSGSGVSFRESYKRYQLVFTYFRRGSSGVYNLAPNVIDNSETVRINGVAVAKGDYTLDYPSGVLRFTNPNRVGKTDKVDVTYEFKPFGASLQNTLLGGRVNYLFAPETYLGVTFLYTGGQAPKGAPTPDQAVSGRMVLGADGSFDLIKLLGFTNSPLSVSGGAEFAYSWYDLNNLGKAMILDMDDSEDYTELSDTENPRIYFTANPRLETNALGILSFIDMRKYDVLGGKTWRDLTYANLNAMSSGVLGFGEIDARGQFKSFAAKAGPFAIGNEGAYDPAFTSDQSSLVFDYIFEPGVKQANYVSVVQGYSTALPGYTNIRGIDASRYVELEIVAKLVKQSETDLDPERVFLLVELGSPSEDFDNNGIRSAEQNSDAYGMDFSYNNSTFGVTRASRHGNGVGIPGSTSNDVNNGNGWLDKEDLNGDDQFSRIDDVVAYPSPDTVSTNVYPSVTNTLIEFPSLATYTTNPSIYTYANTFYEITKLPVYGSSADGMKQTPYLRLKMRIRPDLSVNTKRILEKTTGLRFSILYPGGTTPAKGRLIVDRVRFTASRWSDIFVDGVKPVLSDMFKTVVLNSQIDPEYRYGSGHRIVDDKEWYKTYTELHGTLTASERERLSENALKIQYNLNNVTNTNGAAPQGIAGELRIFNPTDRYYDLSVYKEFSFFVYRESWSTNNEVLLFKFGEQTNRTYVARIPLSLLTRTNNSGSIDVQTGWNKITIKLRESGPGTNVFPVYINDTAQPTASTYRIGSTTLTRISMFSFGVDSSTCPPGPFVRGTLWVNEAHMNDDVMAEGWAWRANANVAYAKELSIGDLPVVSALSANYAHNDSRRGFGSIGQTLSRNDATADSFSFRSTLLKVLAADVSLAQSDSLSDTDERVIPKDSQNYARNGSANIALTMNPGVWYVPTLTHNYSETINKTFAASRYETNAASSGSGELKLTKTETRGRTYGFGETITVPDAFGVTGASISENYTISATIQKTTQQETNSVAESAVAFDKDRGYSRVVGFFYDDENIFDLGKRSATLADYDDIASARYQFSRNQSGSLTASFPWFTTAFSLSHTISHYIDYSATIQGPLSTIFDGNYLQQMFILWSQNEIDMPVNETNIVVSGSVTNTNIITRRRTSRTAETYGSAQSVSVPSIPFLGTLSLSFNESYSESGYAYNSAKTFSRMTNFYTNKSEFLTNLGLYGYGASNDYKNTSVSLSGALAFSLAFKDLWKESPLQSVPVSVNRSITIAENAVPQTGFAYNDTRYEFGLLRYAAAALPALVMPPWYYIDYPFAPLIRMFFGNAARNAEMRHNASKMISELLAYYNGRSLSYFMPYVNDEYYATVNLNESYSLTFQLIEIPVVKLFIPSSLTYSLSLSTARDQYGKISQNDSFSINISKPLSAVDIVRLFNPSFNDPFWSAFTASYSLSYTMNNNYLTKIRSESLNATMYSTLRVGENPLSLSAGYQGLFKKQYLRIADTSPYMGIGIYDAAGPYALFNVGSYEFGYDTTRDSGIAVLDPGRNEHTFTFDAKLDIPANGKWILFFELEKAIQFTHTLHLQIPYLRFASYDETVLFSPDGGALKTAAQYIDSTLNADVTWEFLQVLFEYRIGFNLNEYITINQYNKLPLMFRQYYRTVKELVTKSRWDLVVGLEVGADITFRF